jgi:hypothetical protein
MPHRRDVNFAIARAESILPGRPSPEGNRDPRWQAIIRVAQFIDSDLDAVWQFARKWARHPSPDVRMAVATSLLEHILEGHFDAIFPRLQIEVDDSNRFADTLRSCWILGQAALPKNRARLAKLPVRARPRSAAPAS